jgi:hypothetical protein
MQVLAIDPGAGNTTKLVLNNCSLEAYQFRANAITVLSGTLELFIAQGSTNSLNPNNTQPSGGITAFNGSNIVVDGYDKSGSLSIESHSIAGIGTGIYGFLDFYPSTSTVQCGDILIKNLQLDITSSSSEETTLIGGGRATLSSEDAEVGNITIENSEINGDRPFGGNNAAAIGSGTAGSNLSAKAGDIQINSSTITLAAVGGPGIGASNATSADSDTSTGPITINSSSIYIDMTSGNGSAIGVGGAGSNNSNGSTGDISINSSTVRVLHRYSNGTTIGAGVCIGSNSNASTGNINIQDSVVVSTLAGMIYGTNIGGGFSATPTSDASSKDITIENSEMQLANSASTSGTLIGAGSSMSGNSSVGNIEISDTNLLVTLAANFKGAFVGGGYASSGNASAGSIILDNFGLQLGSNVGKNGDGAYIGAGKQESPYPGADASVGNITIKGASSYVKSASDYPYKNGAGTGIGAGYNARCGNITILDGEFKWRQSGEGAAIGAGITAIGNAGDASCGDISILGGTFDLTHNNGKGAMIGAGGVHSSATSAHADVGDILIDGNPTLNLINGGNASAIGAGHTNAAGNNSSANAGSITINSGLVTINNTGYYSVGLGGGQINSNSVNYNYASVGAITINGGKLHIVSSSGNPAIGSGYQYDTYGSASVDSLTINGGTLVLSGGNTSICDIGRHASYDFATIGGITINGGSIYAQTSGVIMPQPKNSSGEDVFENQYQLGDPAIGGDIQITSGSINSVACDLSSSPAIGRYGINSVWTDTSGKIYPWLTATNDEETVIMNADGGSYVNIFKRDVVPVVKILEITDLNNPAAFIDPEGSLHQDNPEYAKNVDFYIDAIDYNNIGLTMYINYYFDGDDTNVTTVATNQAIVQSPEGVHSITYWASDASGVEPPITKYFFVDHTNPVTTPSKASGTYTTPIDITFSHTDKNASDGADGSGVIETYYTLKKNGNIAISTLPELQTSYGVAPMRPYLVNARPTALYNDIAITLNQTGEYELTYYSVDRAGNIEQTHSADYTLNISGTSTGTGTDITANPNLNGTGASAKTGDSNKNIILLLTLCSLLILLCATIYFALRKKRAS